MLLKSLEFFLAVAESGSFSLAAQKMYTVQSNITSHVKKLEEELGVILLNRHNPVTLTNAGQQLHSYAVQMIALHNKAKKIFQEGDIDPNETIRLGSMETTAAIRLPQLLNECMQQHPNLPLELQTHPTGYLLNAVQQGEVDCAFVASKYVIPELYSLPVWQEQLVLVCPKQQTEFPDIATLAKTRFIAFRQGCSYRHAIELFLNDHSVPPSQIMEMGCLDGIVSCVELGVGFALLPKSYLTKVADKVALSCFEINTESAHFTTYLVAQPADTWGSNLKQFICFIEQQFIQKCA
ncbi:LysR family transcriptional regulator [Acinetobacter nosocomialis]|uniref:LysR family transcriptional regulator n=1 Tax=Acinetobacter nosocomialis TaxID=106654 RepID=UPI001F2E3150|nr:LysR family transcriptional regulator [Acinetobacter nosocomialis]MCE7531835.1 LysR family transcriptional regulator [Acinetobacter nosocomialis]